MLYKTVEEIRIYWKNQLWLGTHSLLSCFFQASQIHFKMMVGVRIAPHYPKVLLRSHLHHSVFLQLLLSRVLTNWSLSPSALQLWRLPALLHWLHLGDIVATWVIHPHSTSMHMALVSSKMHVWAYVFFSF